MGRFNGYGKLEFANGDIYEGHFVKGKYEGKGKYIFKEGGSITG